MHQERSLVHQVERALLRRVGEDVVALDLEIAGPVIREEAKVQSVARTQPLAPTRSASHPRHASGPAAQVVPGAD
jgi:hypothetical protein